MTITYKFARNPYNRLHQEITVTGETEEQVRKQFDSMLPLWKRNDAEIIKEIERVSNLPKKKPGRTKKAAKEPIVTQ